MTISSFDYNTLECIIDFMNNGESSDGEETRQQILKLDQRRQQDLQKIAPELAQILSYAKT